ncbi:MAG: DNA mismatch repair protein MutS, partial [Paludibacteraceae bacterium]|nr:DNA mismatch repair protein MutS [Paludibacteraceae bacterium]
IIASGAVLYYLDHTHHQQISHITSLSRIDEDRFVWLDRFTVRNLELYGTSSDEGVSLLDVLDKTSSPMGARMLKRWIAFPLNVVKPIRYRLEIVDFLLKNVDLRHSLTEALSIVGDMERITSKIAVGRVSPRELSQLRTALNSIGEIHDMLEQCGMQSLVDMSGRINKCSSALRRLTDELSDDPPALLNKGGVIRPGYNKDLDELRDLAFSGKDYINRMEQRETEQTGIPSLKIGFNNVFGYYIEVRNAHKDKVPQEWIRKQTLVNAERYITQELKEYEEKVLGAQEKIDAMEGALFRELVESLNEDISLFQVNCNMLAQLDCMLSFAKVSEENRYVCPDVNDSLVIDIKDGRHPVIEKQLPIGESYIANDVFLDSDSQQIIMITGPNMAGKSALLRQTTLIVLMAQIGCFVPAKSASIGVVDKIFTRVGASDNISMGESTFMVEMTEASNILNNVSSRSLVLFDELGRGTSTYDGISIAWAIVEYLHEHERARARTLFATHYHELNEMEKTYERVKNFNVQVKEINNKVVFLRKLTPGGSEHSFGIHVAKMAGMPRSIIDRATKILKQLEKEHSGSDKDNLKNIDSVNNANGYQLSIFQLDDPVLKSVRDEIANTDIDNLTPIEALNKLYEIKKIVPGKENT